MGEQTRGGLGERVLAARGPRAESLEAFRSAFATLGYAACDEEAPEPGFEKVAVFADDQGIPTHVARQLPSGLWTSKLGRREDLEHGLHDHEGTLYGKVVLLLRRPVPTPS